MKMQTNPVRGTEDYGASEMLTREWARSEILQTYKKFGFLQIKTPILENINLLLGSDIGENSKLMYKVLKRGEKLDLSAPNLSVADLVDVGLRYDLTVPLVRYFCNNVDKLPIPFKAIQIDEVFRADRPQRGRSRQFCQCDIDIIGDNSNKAEVELLYVAGLTLLKLGFNDFVFKINDKRLLDSLIMSCGFDSSQIFDVCVCLDKLNKIGEDGVLQELLDRQFDNDKAVKLMQIISKIQSRGISATSDICPVAYNNLNQIIKSVNDLSKGKFRVEFDIAIIRGQSYYTSTVYEVYCAGFGGACGAGGRYDNMVEKISGQKYSAVGFSIGFEPVCMLIKERNQGKASSGLVIFCEGDEDISSILKYENNFDDERITYAIKAKNLKFQMEKYRLMGFDKYCFYKDQSNKTYSFKND